MSYETNLLENSLESLVNNVPSKLTDANNVELETAFQELALNL